MLSVAGGSTLDGDLPSAFIVARRALPALGHISLCSLAMQI
jgi:hypothetical protein